MAKKKLLLDTEENVTAIKKDYIDNCLTVLQLSEKYKCSTAVIQRFLHKHQIFKNQKFKPSEEEQIYIREKLKEGMLHKDIALNLRVPPYLVNNYINKEILHKGKYSNMLSSEDWITNKSSLFWYFLGLFASDGHLGRFNEVGIFQKDGKYLKELQTLISHSGKLYGQDKTCYIIHISSALLHKTLENYGFNHDKRYNAPYIICPSIKEQMLYIRGLFDGDGSIYYNYVSGRFENINWQICSGSEEVVNGLINSLKNINIKANKECCVNKQSGNKYWHCTIRSKQDIEELFKYLYKDSKYLCLKVKKAKFIKLLKLIEINKQVDDIVDTPMKVGD